MMPILSNHQKGTRNAKVYKDASGKYSVIVFDAVDDYNGYESFYTINEAEDFAESWILKAKR
jgi:hypothetical protein